MCIPSMSLLRVVIIYPLVADIFVFLLHIYLTALLSVFYFLSPACLTCLIQVQNSCILVSMCMLYAISYYWYARI